jgi:hypothetical protein
MIKMSLTEDDIRCIYCGTTKRRKNLMIKEGMDKYCQNLSPIPKECIFQDIHISDLKQEINTLIILAKFDSVTADKIRKHFSVCFMEDISRNHKIEEFYKEKKRQPGTR